MKYMGSKNRIAKHILPIMLSVAEEKGCSTWVEPFVGGANMIDKVSNNFKRIGYDINPHTIKALIGIRDFVEDLPNIVTEQYYKEIKKTEPNEITSWVRFECSFAAKFENGYARNKIGSNYAQMGVNLAKKQSTLIQNVQFICDSYLNIIIPNNSLIYCDPPYKGTTGYKDKFNHAEFWDWCRQKVKEGHTVFVSEYNAPDDFTCVWEGELKTNFASQRNGALTAIEKLFTL